MTPVAETPSVKPLRADLTAQVLAIYWRHVRVYWPWLILWSVGIATAIAGDILAPLAYKRFFDLLAIDPIHTMQRGSLDQIYHTLVLIGVIVALTWAGWRAVVYSVNNFESRTMKDLTDTCFEYLQDHSHRFFTDNFAGALVKRVNRFAASFEVIADQCSFNTGQAAIRLVLVVGVVPLAQPGDRLFVRGLDDHVPAVQFCVCQMEAEVRSGARGDGHEGDRQAGGQHRQRHKREAVCRYSERDRGISRHHEPASPRAVQGLEPGSLLRFDSDVLRAGSPDPCSAGGAALLAEGNAGTGRLRDAAVVSGSGDPKRDADGKRHPQAL